MDDLRDILTSFEGVAIAFSGGVDSSFLLAAAAEALGVNRVVALTALSELTPAREKGRSAEIARSLGVPHLRVSLSALAIPEVASNPRDRCYHCKRAVFSLLLEAAKSKGFAVLLHGANRDDLGDYRPGQKAAEELGVRAPLLEAGLGKEEIRELARSLGLRNWNEPSMACLASRVPYGTPLSERILLRIDDAEEYLRSRFHLRQVRVRDHTPVARIETEEASMPLVLDALNRAEIDRKLKSMGWTFVSIDLSGFKSGSMNGAQA